MKNPFGQIVSFEDYVDIIGIPKEQLNSEEWRNDFTADVQTKMDEVNNKLTIQFV